MRRPATDINTKQRKILDFIIENIMENHRPPTVREICEFIGLNSTSSVASHLAALERFGYINRPSNKNRAIELTDKSMPSNYSRTIAKQPEDPQGEFTMQGAMMRNVPLIGHVQAGMPITAEENTEMVMPLPEQLTGTSECFMLRVHGESMRDIGIYEGDMIIVRNQNTANNGDIVVARIGEEATVKRFFKEQDHIRLQPENDEFEPIITRDCVIEGLVVGLVRDKIS